MFKYFTDLISDTSPQRAFDTVRIMVHPFVFTTLALYAIFIYLQFFKKLHSEAAASRVREITTLLVGISMLKVCLWVFLVVTGTQIRTVLGNDLISQNLYTVVSIADILVIFLAQKFMTPISTVDQAKNTLIQGIYLSVGYGVLLALISVFHDKLVSIGTIISIAATWGVFGIPIVAAAMGATFLADRIKGLVKEHVV